MTAHHRTKEWAAVVRVARPIIKASLPRPCVNPCFFGGVVLPGQRFDVAHILDAHRGGTDALSNLGPAHPRCNRSDGGRAGARLTNRPRTIKQGEPKW